MRLGSGFPNKGDVILLLDGMSDGAAKDGGLKAAATKTEFASSEYAKTIHGIVAGAPPAIDLAAEKRLIDCLVALAAERAVRSAHDVSDGGLAVSVAEAVLGATGCRRKFRLMPRARMILRRLRCLANAGRAPWYLLHLLRLPA